MGAKGNKYGKRRMLIIIKKSECASSKKIVEIVNKNGGDWTESGFSYYIKHNPVTEAEKAIYLLLVTIKNDKFFAQYFANTLKPYL